MNITVLGSGSKGNSTLIQINNKKILIDVGFSYTELKKRLGKIKVDPTQIDYLLITHEHNDHIYGLETFVKKVKPELIIDAKLINILFTANENININVINEELIVDEIMIRKIPVSHDSKVSNGFLIEYNNESVVYLTDTGYIHQNYFKMLANKTYYIIESNHDTEMLINGPYPVYLQKRILSDKGHLSNEFCGNYLTKLIGDKTKKVILAHLSETNNDPTIALDTIMSILKQHDIKFNDIECAPQDEILEVHQ